VTVTYDREFQLRAARNEIDTEAGLAAVDVMNRTVEAWKDRDPELYDALMEGNRAHPERVNGDRPGWERDDIDPDPATMEAFDRRTKANGHQPDLLDGLRTGAWLRDEKFDPLQYHLPGIIPEGSTLLVGPPKIGKSWLLLSLALGVASGGRVLGLSVDARPVLYLALEDSNRRLQSRCERLLGAVSSIPDRFEYMTRIQPGQVLATVEAWLETCPDTAPLVILDTLGKVMPPAVIGESSYQRDYRVGSALKHLVDDRPGSALVIAHHDRKANTDDFVDAVSGTHGLAGSADTIVVLARARQEHSGLLKVTGRDVEEAEYAVTLKAGSTWELAGHSITAAVQKAVEVHATAGVGDRMADVISFVLAHPDGVGPSEVAEALDLDADAVSAYLGRALKGGRIDRPTRGLYTPVGSVGSVGKDDEASGDSHSESSNPTVPTLPTPLLGADPRIDTEER
jgi:hypothetical protein